MTFSSSVFKDSVAQDGSMIYMMNDATLLMTNPTMSYGKARRYGGGIYAGGSLGVNSPVVTPKITI